MEGALNLGWFFVEKHFRVLVWTKKGLALIIEFAHSLLYF